MKVVDARMLHSSGIGTYLQALLPRLIARVPGPWVALQKPGDPDIDGTRRIDVAAGVYSAWEQAALRRAIPGEASVVWSPHVNVPAMWAGRLLVTVHDVFYLEPEWAKGVRADKRLYLSAMMKAVAWRADEVLTVSAFTKERLATLLPALTAPVTVVHNAVEPAWLAPIAPPAVERPYVIAVGNVKPHKNLAALVRAFVAIAERVPHELVIVGRAEGFAGGTGLDAALRHDRVRFTGHVPFDELRSLVAGADVMAFVSLYEGFGLPPLEAMASGTAVLAGRAASVPEVCGDAAAYCDPRDEADIADRLEGLLGDENGRAGLVAAGRARVAEFSWDRAAEATAAALERCVDGR